MTALSERPVKRRVMLLDWILKNLAGKYGPWHHGSLGDAQEWRVLLRRGLVKRQYRREAYYALTAKGKKYRAARKGAR